MHAYFVFKIFRCKIHKCKTRSIFLFSSLRIFKQSTPSRRRCHTSRGSPCATVCVCDVISALRRRKFENNIEMRRNEVVSLELHIIDTGASASSVGNTHFFYIPSNASHVRCHRHTNGAVVASFVVISHTAIPRELRPTKKKRLEN